MDQLSDQEVLDDEGGPQDDDKNFEDDVKMEDDDDEESVGRDYEGDREFEEGDDRTLSPKREIDDDGMSPNREDQDSSNSNDEDNHNADKPKKSAKDSPAVPTTIEGCKSRIYELEQDINFLKQSITTVYEVFRCFNNLILDIDIDSVPDLVYFMEKLSDHLKDSDSIKNKAEGIGDALGAEANVDREELERQIYDVVENCNSCKGVVSKINLLVTKFRSYKRKMEFKLDGRARKAAKAGTEAPLDNTPACPNSRKEGDPEEEPTESTYFGLPTVQGEDGQEEVIYTGQDFDMDQYLRQGGVKRKRPSKYNCGACGKVFNKLKYVKSHYNHQHVVQKKLFCGECGLSFSYKSNLTRHLRLIHMEERKEKCPECDESFGTKMQLDSHMRKTHEAPKLHCNDCGQTFIQEQSLRNHGEVCPANNHQVKVMCGICMKSFAAKRYLQNHIRSKHTDRVSHHVCDICNKSFSGQFALKRHRVKKHRNEVENLSIKGESEYNIDITNDAIRGNKPWKDEEDESMEEGEEHEGSEDNSSKKSKGRKKGTSTSNNKGKAANVDAKQSAGKAGKKDATSKANSSLPKTPIGNKSKARKSAKSRSKTKDTADKSEESEKPFEIISRNVDYDNLLISQEVGSLDNEGDDDRTKFIGAINLQERQNSTSPDLSKKDLAMFPVEDEDIAESGDNMEKKQNKRKRSSVKKKGNMDDLPSPTMNKSASDNLVYYEGRLWENNPNGPPTPRPFAYVDESAVDDRFRMEPTAQRSQTGFNNDTNYNNDMRAEITNNEKDSRNVINFPQVGAGSPSALKDSQENHMRPPPNVMHYNSGNMMSGDMNNMGANLPPNLQSNLDPRAFEQLRRLTSGSMQGFGMNSGIRQSLESGVYPGMMQNIGPDPSIYNRPEMNQRYYANTGPHLPMMSNQYSGPSHMGANRQDRQDNM